MISIKKILFTLLIGVILQCSCDAQNNEAAILGKWMSSENNLAVEVYKQQAAYKARVIRFDDSDDKTKQMNERVDEKNKDKTLRSKKIIGMEALRGLQYNKDDNEWQHGIIYDSSSGKEWDAKA